ncbi:MAG: hypothetical protein QGG36_26925 [Pirellulaceae bacterium]|nr:hypothetical protein [Pirellulaceae bacterium]
MPHPSASETQRPSRSITRAWPFALLFGLILLADPSPGVAVEPQVELSVGFAGVAKAGHTTTVRVKVTAGDAPLTGRLRITAPDSDGLLSAYTAPEAIDLASGESATRDVVVKLGRVQCVLRASVVKDGREQASGSRVFDRSGGIVESTRELILRVGPKLDIQDALRRNRARWSRKPLIVAVKDPSEFPRHWSGYGGVDWFVVSTSDELALQFDDQQLAALEMWVRLGGRLIVSANMNTEQLLQKPQWRALAPGEFAGSFRQSQTAMLESYTRAQERLGPFSMSRFEQVRGRSLIVENAAGQGKDHILMRYPHGFGIVTFCAADLDQPPFDTWANRTELLAGMLNATAESNIGLDEKKVGIEAHMGFDDLSGQLRSALDNFDDRGVSTIAFSPIAAILVLYILLIGPGDYFFLKRFVRRMEWTWATFVGVVAVFSISLIACFWLLKGTDVHHNQVDLVDIDAETGVVRALTLANVYSPRTQAFDLSIEPAADAVERWLSWNGLPGAGLGGINTTARAAVFDTPYAMVSVDQAGGGDAGTGSLTALPIQVGSTKSLAAGWWRMTEPPQSALRKRGTRLRGELVNPFGVEIVDAAIVHDGLYYPIREPVAAGETVRLSDLAEPRELDWHLTRRRVLLADSSYRSTPWDAASKDIPRIVEMLMFYESSGGESYVQLTNRYLDQIDLSPHLQFDRAVLVGRAAGAACRLQRNGEPLAGSNWTFYRAVLPVGKSE